MRPYNDYYDEFDDVEEFAYRRSQALQKLLDGHRREERHSNRHRSFSKDRHHREAWDWEDDDDWDSYLDDSSADFNNDLNSHY